jgi:enolase-phosphatase E1
VSKASTLPPGFIAPGGAALLDIEGTITPIAFVKETLFPFARQRIAQYVTANQNDPTVAAQIADVAKITGGVRPDVAATVHVLLQWSDEDRKATPLKTVQGLIWRAGYESGELRAPVFADAVQQMRAWVARGVPIYIYSSGSVAAQKLLLRYSNQGDLLPLCAGYFDTTIGGKLEPASYQAIATAVGVAAPAVTFFSDHVGETAAARRAGMAAVCLQRPGEVPPVGDPWDGPALTAFGGQ